MLIFSLKLDNVVIGKLKKITFVSFFDFENQLKQLKNRNMTIECFLDDNTKKWVFLFLFAKVKLQVDLSNLIAYKNDGNFIFDSFPKVFTMFFPKKWQNCLIYFSSKVLLSFKIMIFFQNKFFMRFFYFNQHLS